MRNAFCLVVHFTCLPLFVFPVDGRRLLDLRDSDYERSGRFKRGGSPEALNTKLRSSQTSSSFIQTFHPSEKLNDEGSGPFSSTEAELMQGLRRQYQDVSQSITTAVKGFTSDPTAGVIGTLVAVGATLGDAKWVNQVPGFGSPNNTNLQMVVKSAQVTPWLVEVAGEGVLEAGHAMHEFSSRDSKSNVSSNVKKGMPAPLPEGLSQNKWELNKGRIRTALGTGGAVGLSIWRLSPLIPIDWGGDLEMTSGEVWDNLHSGPEGMALIISKVIASFVVFQAKGKEVFESDGTLCKFGPSWLRGDRPVPRDIQRRERRYSERGLIIVISLIRMKVTPLLAVAATAAWTFALQGLLVAAGAGVAAHAAVPAAVLLGAWTAYRVVGSLGNTICNMYSNWIDRRAANKQINALCEQPGNPLSRLNMMLEKAKTAQREAQKDYNQKQYAKDHVTNVTGYDVWYMYDYMASSTYENQQFADKEFAIAGIKLQATDQKVMYYEHKWELAVFNIRQAGRTVQDLHGGKGLQQYYDYRAQQAENDKILAEHKAEREKCVNMLKSETLEKERQLEIAHEENTTKLLKEISAGKAEIAHLTSVNNEMAANERSLKIAHQEQIAELHAEISAGKAEIANLKALMADTAAHERQLKIAHQEEIAKLQAEIYAAKLGKIKWKMD